jgi:hypothetical protein
LCAVILTLGLLEAALWAMCLVSPRVNRLFAPAAIPDDLLDFRPNPAYFEHDAHGFRNAGIPAAGAIVCIGDSQTYGSGVDVLREGAWPQQLETISGRKTYNMAFGGYGPTHYLHLCDEAIAMKPAVIVVGFYGGNDLYDVFHMVYIRNKMDFLKTRDPKILAAMAAAEKTHPLPAIPAGPAAIQPSVWHFVTCLPRTISDHSKICGFIRAGGRLMVNSRILAALNSYYLHPFGPVDPAVFQTYNDGKFRTVFTTSKRVLALNLDDVRISESLRIALESMRLMREKARQSNSAFYVLLIPTKELVFKELVIRDGKKIPAEYDVLIKNEEKFREQTIRYLKAQGIPYFDALPGLRYCLFTGSQPYAVTGDGHPNKIGNAAIAHLVSDGLKAGTKNFSKQ